MSVQMDKSVVAILTEAKALIDTPDKWCQKRMTDEGQYCAAGAVAQAETGSPYRITANSPARKALIQSCPEPIAVLAEYNDRHSHEEVMAWFDKAIADAALATGEPNADAGGQGGGS